jgi:predicted ArsR family transcriptional regulator
MSESDRDGGGRYTPSVTDADILGILERASAPVMTATEIADELPIGRSAVRKRLVDLHERGTVERKSVGARSVVWWIVDEDDETPDFKSGFGAFAETDLEAQVEQASEEFDQGAEERQDALFGH